MKSGAGVAAGIAVVGLLVWNFGVHSENSNQLFVATTRFLSKHWLAVTIAVGLAFAYRPISRWSPFLRGVIIVTGLVVFLYRPNTYVKHLNLLWYPTDPTVYDVLRQRKGIVSSLSPQGEVSWVSDRKNIPVPELPMHIYSFVFDHQLEIEDIYLESAETMISPIDGVFTFAAPGFEGYARLQQYRGKVPGYDLVFYSSAMRGYPKYSVKPRPKASSVYRLVDRTAVLAMAHSPDRIDLGSVDNVIYTAHGWGGYFRIDEKPAVAATDITRSRYWGERPMKPWEDTSATFFLDDRRPSSIELEIYATHPTTVEFYWNLDLYYYDRTEDRKLHSIGTYTITHTGWQTVHLDVPRSLTRAGLNKLGFRIGEFQAITVCPPTASDAACAAMHQTDDEEPTKPRQLPPAIVVHDSSAVAPAAMNASLFVGALDLHYDHP
jgi:hypothetical protein